MNLRILCALAFGLLAAAPAAAGEETRTKPNILMDGIEKWTAEIFAGCPAAKSFVPGPKLETVVGGIMAFDSKGTAYLACETFVGIITTDGRAGVLTGAPDVAGNTDGPPGEATFGNAIDIALVNDDLLYVVDGANLTLRRIERKKGVWITSTVAGKPGVKGHADGAGEEVRFTTPFESLTVDEKGIVYLMDGDWLRKFEGGKITTLNAGSGYRNGPLAQALFQRSQGRQHGMTYDGQGNLYIADKLNMAIRKVDLKKGEVSTIAGTLPDMPKDRPRDGPALEARFHPGGGPNMIFYDKAGDCLIARSDDEDVIRIIKDGWMKTFGPAPGGGDKRPLAGGWKDVSGGVPCGVGADGTVYVMGAQCIRAVRQTKGGGR
ncbi:MAG TPA: hypothetical protein PK280_03805 [Planctomycetota bacterium]|nr:hypothetical protein [Planctomycetota bacterium]